MPKPLLYTPEYLRSLIDRHGGPEAVSRLAARHNISIHQDTIRKWARRGLTSMLPPKSESVVELLEASSPPIVSVDTEEFRALVYHFGGPSGVHRHLEQHHYSIRVCRETIQEWRKHGGPTTRPGRYQRVYRALLADKPRYKSCEGKRYMSPMIGCNR